MAKSIMIQGTASNAGKSLIAGGLCRVLSRDGYRVAPFKSQNMALNSYITADGMEMGRAQVMQAECAGILPDVRMNPILLKPTGESGSQVIVNGEVVGNMSAREYYAWKHNLIEPIMKAYRSLESEYDIIVLEGAGSPAEINLRRQDFVNMGMAKLAGAPVLLVGDIDRGGVFASLLGTSMLLEEDERALLSGVIINKFRGDVEILRPGLTELERLMQKPVLGVVPYIDVDIDDEDSLSERLHNKRSGGLLDVAVIHLPRMSNFTDFAPLAGFSGVDLRYIRRVEELGAPDLIILPGTKNTISDLKWMRQNGLEAAVLRQAGRGVPVIGICGGYQMLGRTLNDPHGVEQGGSARGLCLLEMETSFEPQKNRAQVRGRFGDMDGFFRVLSGLEFTGYEIHMGHSTSPEGAKPLSELKLADGTVREDGYYTENVMGSYVHGLFDAEPVTRALVSALLERKGLPAISESIPGTGDRESYKQEQYDLLADTLRSSLDMDKIYEIINEGGGAR